jgi:hypothetical protein
MRHFVVVFGLALLTAARAAAAQRGFPVPAAAQSFPNWLRDPFREAAAILQANHLPGADTASILDSALVAQVAEAMAHIRARIPDLGEAVTDRTANAFRLMFIPDTGRRIWPNRQPDSEFVPLRRWQALVVNDVPRVGLPRLDSLNRRHRASAVVLSMIGERADSEPRFEATIVFPNYVNVPRMLQLYRGVPGTTWLHELEMAMTYVHAELALAPSNPNAWRFTFREGRGDCPAGCTAAVNSVVDYDRQTRQVSLVRRDTIGRP